MKAGFKVSGASVMQHYQTEAAEFYTGHKERTLFGSLTMLMTSGKCMPLVLQKADAVAALRGAIGATDPKEAADGTVRKLFA